MAIRLSTHLANDMLGTQDMQTALAGGFIAIYSGAQPASPDDPASGTLLAVIYSDGATASTGLTFDAPVDNVLSKAAAETWSGVATNNGTAGWFRFYQLVTNAATSLTEGTDDDSVSKSNARLDGSVATSGGDLNISSTTITSGATQTVSSFSITQPLA
jgi:hypothetical protein